MNNASQLDVEKFDNDCNENFLCDKYHNLK